MLTGAVLHWITSYGYWGIFSLLVLGIVGIPVPDETLLTFAGYLAYRRDLHLAPTIAAAFLGSACGITVSYSLGRTAGFALVRRYGRYLHITGEKVAQVHRWFERIGRWSLVIGYFIPGVRHIIALVAGASRLQYPVFALFAYSGGIIWALTFISIGFLFGEEWTLVLKKVHGNFILGAGLVLGLIFALLILRRIRRIWRH